MKKIICRCIWNLSEWSGIPLGRYAPIVFGGMIGCKSKELIDDLEIETSHEIPGFEGTRQALGLISINKEKLDNE